MGGGLPPLPPLPLPPPPPPPPPPQKRKPASGDAMILKKNSFGTVFLDDHQSHSDHNEWTTSPQLQRTMHIYTRSNLTLILCAWSCVCMCVCVCAYIFENKEKRVGSDICRLSPTGDYMLFYRELCTAIHA